LKVISFASFDMQEMVVMVAFRCVWCPKCKPSTRSNPEVAVVVGRQVQGGSSGDMRGDM